MWDDETAWLKNKIFVVEKRTKTEDDKKVKAVCLDEIVEFTGWQPASYQGRLLKYVIDDGIRSFRGNLRKSGDPYYLHNVMALKEVSKFDDGKTTDITLAVGALKHDDIEEASGYEWFKKKYIGAKDDVQREKARKELDKIVERCRFDSAYFFSAMGDSLIGVSGINTGEVISLMENLTKGPDESYPVYLARVFGKRIDKDIASLSMLNLVRSAIIKVKGDRLHNTNTLPKTLFTVPQRNKECLKSILAINRAVNFIEDYKGQLEPLLKYASFLDSSRYDLCHAVCSVLEENLKQTSDELSSMLGYDRGAWVLGEVHSLFKDYDDYRIMPPPTLADVINDPRKIYDGTLARLENWISKDYRGWGLARPENIAITEANKFWMRIHLGIDDPHVRAVLQQHIDSLELKGVCEKFSVVGSNYKLEGWGGFF